jgi:hypothetical protein
MHLYEITVDAVPPDPMAAVTAIDVGLAGILGGQVVSSCPVLADGTLYLGSRRSLTSFQMPGGGVGVLAYDITTNEAVDNFKFVATGVTITPPL